MKKWFKRLKNKKTKEDYLVLSDGPTVMVIFQVTGSLNCTMPLPPDISDMKVDDITLDTLDGFARKIEADDISFNSFSDLVEDVKSKYIISKLKSDSGIIN